MVKLNLHDSFLGRHLNSASRKRLANCLSVHYLKTNQDPFELKICKNKGIKLLKDFMKVDTQENQ